MKVTITSVEQLKAGVSNGRAWVLYKVTAPEVGHFTTFNGSYTQKIGQTVDVELIKGKNPKYPNDWSEATEKKSNASDEDVKQAIRLLWKHIDERFDQLEGKTPAPVKEEDIPVIDDTSGVNPSDIPF